MTLAAADVTYILLRPNPYREGEKKKFTAMTQQAGRCWVDFGSTQHRAKRALTERLGLFTPDNRLTTTEISVGLGVREEMVRSMAALGRLERDGRREQAVLHTPESVWREALRRAR